ncbi:hypothetical protein PYCCODRAFT_841816 [Trametes coccinea BRFM310]|uniref:Uncharacterized protein n=1 Tax=Trametes coccinea (strain BRFM310) TaxID=1353009 RepID=A0A1Y2IFL1_TRAC3|nr:hypothetical protein PYCCODRAFT_841816 [Trametes coccinea BRFM310]
MGAERRRILSRTAWRHIARAPAFARTGLAQRSTEHRVRRRGVARVMFGVAGAGEDRTPSARTSARIARAEIQAKEATESVSSGVRAMHPLPPHRLHSTAVWLGARVRRVRSAIGTHGLVLACKLQLRGGRTILLNSDHGQGVVPRCPIAKTA